MTSLSWIKSRLTNTHSWLFLGLFLPGTLLGQSIWTNPITDPNPSLLNPFWMGSVSHPNISVGGIGRGTGVVGVASANRYNGNSWNTAALDPDAYYEFELKPDADCQINLISFVYTGQVSVNAPSNFAFRSSLDGFTANIGAPTATGTTIDLSGAAYQAIPGTVIFRLYAWNALSSAGNFSINDFTFNGTVNCGVILPISMLDLHASWAQGQVQLNWGTASEINSDFFSVERSVDGLHFTEINRVAAQGNSSSLHAYEMFDLGPWGGERIYYRIKAVDLNGDFYYSNIASVTNHMQRLYYSDGFIYFYEKTDQILSHPIRIYTAAGQLLLDETYETNQLNQFLWQANGIFIIQFPDSGEAQKLVIE